MNWKDCGTSWRVGRICVQMLSTFTTLILRQLRWNEKKYQRRGSQERVVKKSMSYSIQRFNDTIYFYIFYKNDTIWHMFLSVYVEG